MMSGIGPAETKPELQVRKLLRGLGYRLSYNVKSLPGKPDIVIRREKIAIFVHGCFWHRHECHLFKWPASRPEFWRTKLNRNAEKDAESQAALLAAGWRVLTVWECALKGRRRLSAGQVSGNLARWLKAKSLHSSISHAVELPLVE